MNLNDYPHASATQLCPVCGHVSDRKLRKHEIWIRNCNLCGHQFAELTLTQDSVAKIYDGQYFQGDGSGYVDYLDEAQRLKAKGRYYGQLLESFCWPGRVLDVGAAAGFILQGLSQFGWQGQGLEPNERLVEYGNQHLHLKIIPGTLETFHSETRYDLVLMIQVLSHVYDLHQALQIASQVTKSGGYWLIETWNRISCLARLYGNGWRAYDPPAEHHWFTPKTLRQLVKHYGFTEVKRGPVMQLINRAQLQHHLRYQGADHLWKRLLSRGLQVIPNQVNILAPVGDRFWALFEKTD